MPYGRPLLSPNLRTSFFYIANQDRRPETGEKIYYEIRNLVDKHAQSQLSGREHPDAPGGWRYIQCKRWLIFYQAHPAGIEIMRVIDAVRDLPKHLPKDQ